MSKTAYTLSENALYGDNTINTYFSENLKKCHIQRIKSKHVILVYND
jgi:hypothetical protein